MKCSSLLYQVALTKQNLYFFICKVSDSWVEQVGVTPPSTGLVRSFNMFPTCDRVRYLDGGKRLRVEHFMSTSIGGWISNWFFNVFFKSALLTTYEHEAENFRKYIQQHTANEPSK